MKNPFAKMPVDTSMFAAVHLITESSDHYNFLVQHHTAEDILKYIAGQLGTELAYVCNWFITAENTVIAETVKNELESWINECQDSPELYE